MPLHDFRCLACRIEWSDVYVPVATRASASGVRCADCGALLTWVPAAPAVDAREPFQQFEVQILQPDGSHKPVTIGSLSQLRRIESQAETAYRNGEGQRMIFRAWSQDRSNLDEATLGESGGTRPDPAWVRKHGRAIRSASEPDVPMGPGAVAVSPLDAL
jgi:hypothetical protein